jgi:uncharacterized membrane-anchored protein
MKRIALIAFAVVGLAQLSVPAWAVWMRTQTLHKGKLWKFRIAPVDPSDAFRGRYVTLSFAAEQVPRAEPIHLETPTYAYLKENSRGFAEVDQLSTTPTVGDNVVKVVPDGWWNNVQRVKFPFERLWLDEKVAPAADRIYARTSRQQKSQNFYVTVRVYKGDAAVEQLFVDDIPLGEYSREK